jgi:PAS domain S-box-containing protein
VTLLTDKILAELLDTAPDAMLAFNDDGVIVMANVQAQLLFDDQQHDLLGLPIASLVPDASPTRWNETSGVVLTGLRHGGEEFRAEISLSSLKDGPRSLVTAVIRDVSARSEREAERQRVGSQAEDERRVTKAALVTAEDEKVVADDARVVAEAALVTAERDKALAEHARLEAEVERYRCEVEIAETEHARLAAEVQRVKAEAEKSEAERLLLETEVERVKCEVEIAEAEHARLEAEVVLERLEAQLHQSQRMESLGQLAGGVAHDFNNLLAVIMNYASFVSEELSTAAATSPGSNWSDLLNDVQQIQVAADRASVLTHQLLAFARREVVQVRPLNLNSAVRSIEEILRRTIGEQIDLTITLDPLLSAVMADPGQVEQIILNLAINARDAMPSGGTLSIATSSREINSAEYSVFGAPAGSYTCLRVSDNGVGMSSDVRDRAFEPFFTTKPKGEGTGLGLATVYGIVLQSGGFTRIDSDEGVGTTVTVLLPAKTGRVEPREQNESP